MRFGRPHPINGQTTSGRLKRVGRITTNSGPAYSAPSTQHRHIINSQEVLATQKNRQRMNLSPFNAYSHAHASLSCLLILRGIIPVSGKLYLQYALSLEKKENPPMTRHKLCLRSTTKRSDGDHCISPQHARTHQAGKNCSVRRKGHPPGGVLRTWFASVTSHTHTREWWAGSSVRINSAERERRERVAALGMRLRRQIPWYMCSRLTYSFPFLLPLDPLGAEIIFVSKRLSYRRI